jgi:hypothetical protein
MAERPPTDRDPRTGHPRAGGPAGGAVLLARGGAQLADGAQLHDHAARCPRGPGRLPAREHQPRDCCRLGGPDGHLLRASRQAFGVARRRAPAAAAVTRPGGGANGPFRAALKARRSFSPFSCSSGANL